jgi:branched-subunit amino acid transport protein
MTWTLIIILAVVVFFNRYFFLEPKVNIRLPVFVEKMVSYAAHWLLSVICIPIVFFNEDNAWRSVGQNAYFWAALVACVVAYRVKSVLLNMAISLAVFYGLLLGLGW